MLAEASSASALEAEEQALIRRAQTGEAIAFAQLLEANYNSLYRFAYRWCGNPSDAEDVTQLACIKLARSLGQFRFESAFSSWLYRLVINCAKDWRRTQTRHQGEALPDTDLNPEENDTHNQTHNDSRAEQSIYLQQVLRLVDTFADGFKETALLVYAEGLTHAEAANILHIKESTVSWRLHEIRKQLQLWQQTQGDSWEVQS
jgi:RNA polymerase sigma-70 factor, ECF subfamily